MDKDARIDSLDELRTFVSIVDAGSLRAAATGLGVTPNAVSRRLSMLEERVGRRLIHRTTRRMSITEEGRRFVIRCRSILGEIEEAERELAGADELGGTLRIGIHNDLVNASLMASLKEMLDASPRLRLQLSVGSTFVDPIAAGLDLSIHVGMPPESSLIARPLGFSLTWSLAATPGYLRRRGQPSEPEALIDHECLRILRDGSENHWNLSRGAQSHQRFPIGGRFEASDGGALAAALYAGIGIGVRLRSEIDEAVAAGVLEHVLADWQWASLPLYAMLPKGRLKVPAVRAVIDAFRRSASSRS